MMKIHHGSMEKLNHSMKKSELTMLIAKTQIIFNYVIIWDLYSSSGMT